MFIPKNKLIVVVAVAAAIGLTSGQALAQEGVLHRLARAVIAIPEAVLHSLHGPSCKEEDCENAGPIVRYPYPVQVNYGQSYGYAVPPESIIQNTPGYVTYNVIQERPGCRGQEQADTHIYSPIPFSSR